MDDLISVQPERTEERTETHECDLISRQATIDALWKALYDYEDKTEKQFQESEELDVGEWIVHRGFVQNMSDIARQTILQLPPVTERTGHWIWDAGDLVCSECGTRYSDLYPDYDESVACPHCGAKMEVEHDSN